MMLTFRFRLMDGSVLCFKLFLEVHIHVLNEHEIASFILCFVKVYRSFSLFHCSPSWQRALGNEALGCICCSQNCRSQDAQWLFSIHI